MWYRHHHSKNKLLLQKFVAVENIYAKATTIASGLVMDCPSYFDGCSRVMASSKFSLGRSKISYLLSDGLGPYYKRELVNMIRESGCAFTLQYDETGNVQNRKQCDILIRYWSATSKQVFVRFFYSLDDWTCKVCRQ